MTNANPENDFSMCGSYALPETNALEQKMLDHEKRKDGPVIENLPQNRPAVLQSLQDNEDGDAFLFIDLHKGEYLYDRATAKWYYWNDHYWREDKLGHVYTRFNNVIQLYMDQETYEMWNKSLAKKEGRTEDEKRHAIRAEDLKKRIRDLHTIKRKKNVLALAILGKNSLGNTGENWDTKPMLLGCQNGVIDLETGKFRDGKPDDYIKRVCSINWDEQYRDCPTWKKFLLEILGDDREMVSYLKRLLGYGITGLTTEHIYPFLYGRHGRNGKTTILELLKFILGKMAFKVPVKFFIQNKTGKDGGGPDSETMAFRGARMVWSAETNDGDKLDVAKTKELSGGDTLSARPPYGKRQIEFRPTHLLLLLTNKLPKVPANDSALWQRLHIIEFKYSYVSNPDPNKSWERKKDPKLLKKLEAEAPAILRWLVEGCLEWQEFGLMPPDSVIQATRRYRDSEDILGLFIKEACVQGDPKDQAYRIKPKDLYSHYRAWCEEVGHHAMAKKRFLDDMRERFQTVRNSCNYFAGVTALQHM